jgi:hypothetical protein
MRPGARNRIVHLLCGSLIGFYGSGAAGAPPPTDPAPRSEAAGAARDGRHDFDFELGNWRTHLKRLLRPLSGSAEWVEYEGTTVVRGVFGGRANLVELTVDGPAGRLEVASFRLYDPESRQWRLYPASAAGGELGPPAVGEFRDGRGEFYSHEPYDGRMVLVRFVIHQVAPDTWRFEQSFSDDGGRTWELNWIATDTRIPEGSEASR